MAEQTTNDAPVAQAPQITEEAEPEPATPTIVNFRHDSLNKIEVPQELLKNTQEEEPLVEEGAAEEQQSSKKKKKKRQNMKGKNERQKERLKNLQQDLDQISEENKALKQSLLKMKDLETSGKDQLQTTVTKLKAEMMSLKKTLANREGELKSENVGLQEKITLELKEKKQLAQNLEKIQTESAQVKEECDRLKTCAQDFKKELDAMHKAKVAAVKEKPDAGAQEAGGDELKEKFQKIAKNLKMSETQREELKAANEQLKAALNKELDEKKALVEKMSKSAPTGETDQNQIDELLKELNKELEAKRALEEKMNKMQSEMQKPTAGGVDPKQVEELITKLKMSESNQEKLKAANEQLKSELNKQVNANNQMNEQMKKMNAEATQAKEQCFLLNKEADKLKKELQLGATKSSPSSNGMASHKEEEYKKNIDELLTNLKNCEIDRAELKSQNSTIIQKLTQEQGEKNAMIQRIEAIKTEFMKMQEGFTHARGESEALKLRLNEVTENMKRKEEEISDHLKASEQIRSDAKKEILSLRQQITMVQMDKTHATSQLNTANNKLKQLQDDCAKLKTAVEKKQRVRGKSETESNDEKALREALAKHKLEFQTQMTAMLKKLEESTNVQKHLTTENNNLRQAVDQLKNQSEAPAQKSSVEQQEEDSWVKVDTPSKKEETLEKEKIQLQKQISNLKSSHSQLTAANNHLRSEVEQGALKNKQLAMSLSHAHKDADELKKKCGELENLTKNLRGKN